MSGTVAICPDCFSQRWDAAKGCLACGYSIPDGKGDAGRIASAVALERAACAKVASDFAAQGDWDKDTAEAIAASIKNRTNVI